MQIGVSFLHIVAVLLDAMTETSYMVVRVVANAVSLTDYALVEFRIFTNIVAYHEECSLYTVLCQHIEDVWRSLRYRTIIKG
jgi:hypothetical protein